MKNYPACKELKYLNHPCTDGEGRDDLHEMLISVFSRKKVKMSETVIQ